MFRVTVIIIALREKCSLTSHTQEEIVILTRSEPSSKVSLLIVQTEECSCLPLGINDTIPKCIMFHN